MNLTLIGGAVADAIKDWFQGWFGAILSFIPKIFYQILTALFALIDIVQWIMRKLAGLDTIYSFNGVKNVEGDIVVQFINMIFLGTSPVLANIFWSMIILGVLMLVLTTMIAVVKSEYIATDAKSASKGKIIGNSFKALLSFAIVPIVCFFGIFLCNVILQAMDKITTGSVSNKTIDFDSYIKAERPTNVDGKETGSETYNNYSFFGFKVPTNSTPISGMIFKASAYNANRARNDTNFYQIMMNNDKVAANGLFSTKKSTDSSSVYTNCWIMDEAFANCYQLKTKTKIDRDPFVFDHMFPVTLSTVMTTLEFVLVESGYDYFDKNNVALVWYYYDLWSFDFIIAIGSFVIVGVLLFYLLFGLIKRIFELVILFLVAAPITSLMPLDGGNALKKWREKFVAKTISVYGPIVGLNLFFVVLSILQSLQLTGIAIVDNIVNLCITISGLAMVKDFTKMLSEIIGGEDSLSNGADKAKDIGATAKRVGSFAASVGGLGLTAMKYSGGTGFLAAKGAKKTVQSAQSAVAKFQNWKQTRAANAAEKAQDKQTLKDKAKLESGKGIYKKGSTAYDNAVANMADGDFSDREIVAASKANSMSDKEALELINKDVSASLNFLNFGPNHNLKKVPRTEKERAKLWKKLTKDEKAAVKNELAENEVAKMSQNELKRFGVVDRGIEANRIRAAQTKLDNMNWQEKKQIIDDNSFYSRSQNSKIRQRAIDAVGGITEYRKMDDEKRAHKRDLYNPYMIKPPKNQETVINAEKISFGAKAAQSLGGAFKDIAKSLGSFAQSMFDSMKGPMMSEMKGLPSEMISRAQGKLNKDRALDDEIKNQKKIMNAQAKAQKLLKGNREEPEPERKPKPTELSDTSIKNLANAIQTKSSQSPSSVKLDDSSISKLGSAIADKLNKKD